VLFRLQKTVASWTFIELENEKGIWKCVIETLFLYAKIISVIDQTILKLLQERMIRYGKFNFGNKKFIKTIW